jgi:hypothetical protein
MFRDGKPAGFPNGTRLGRIVTTHGQSDVVVDTEFVVEISTAPFNQANADNLSNLGLHLAEVTELLQNTNTPTRGIQLEDAYKDLTFKLDGKLTGDFHINVSPHENSQATFISMSLPMTSIHLSCSTRQMLRAKARWM